MNKIALRLRSISETVAAWLSEQPDTKEESVTDLLLWQLSDLEHVTTRVHSHAQERRSGADWEWLLWTEKDALGIRIQAKKLASRQNARRIGYRSGEQLNRLIATAEESGQVPAYAFYTSRTDATAKCGKVATGGVFFCPARTLQAKVEEKKTSTAQIVGYSTPISCLFSHCPDVGFVAALLPRVRAFLMRQFPEARLSFPSDAVRRTLDRINELRGEDPVPSNGVCASVILDMRGFPESVESPLTDSGGDRNNFESDAEIIVSTIDICPNPLPPVPPSVRNRPRADEEYLLQAMELKRALYVARYGGRGCSIKELARRRTDSLSILTGFYKRSWKDFCEIMQWLYNDLHDPDVSNVELVRKLSSRVRK
jgi:hypothetical protein